MWTLLLAGIILAAIALQDGISHIIPGYMLALLLGCGVIHGFWEQVLLQGLLGFALCGLPILILSIIFPDGIGGGDSKLCAALGFLLGPIEGCLVILLSLILLCIWGIFQRKRGQGIPFGPFVFPAYMAVIFLL